MSKLVEAMARAMRPECWDEKLLPMYGDLWMYAEQAKLRTAAVSALRAMAEVEPSESMTLAAAEAAYENDHFDNIYRAMLTQAVAEAQESGDD
jgi:hypothetical protein